MWVLNRRHGTFTLSIISTFLWSPLLSFNVFLEHCICKSDVLVWYAFVLCLPEIGDFSSKHAGEFVFTDDIQVGPKVGIQ